MPDNTNKRGDYVGVRLGHELRARAIYAANMLNMSLSDWMRMTVQHALDGGLGAQGDPTAEGFVQGRAVGFQLVQAQLHEILQAMIANGTMTFEEYQQRYPHGVAAIDGARTIQY